LTRLVNCPVHAISRDDNGLVRTDEAKCIKCQRCVANCPYGARWPNPVTMVPQSCLGPGCRALVAKGQPPACVQACPATARLFGDTADPASAISKRISAPGYRRVSIDKGTRPNYYVLDKS
jgi:protein NrfC